MQQQHLSTERYPAGFSDNATHIVREAIWFGIIPELSVEEFESELASMTLPERDLYVQGLWDRL